MNHLKIVALSAFVALTASSGMLCVSTAHAQQQQLPRHVAGKIVNVSHEKVQVNQKWLDKMSVTVESCQEPGTLKTVHYTPGFDSDRSALGHLFDQDIQSAYTPDMPKQQLPNGYGVFWTNEDNKVLRTGLLGSKLDCRAVPSMLQQF